MATKVATVTARIEPDIKKKAESILSKIGIPISVLIDTLYRQIILTGGIPYSISVPKINTLDSMDVNEFNYMLEKGFQEAEEGKAISKDEAFKIINKVI